MTSKKGTLVRLRMEKTVSNPIKCTYKNPTQVASSEMKCQKNSVWAKSQQMPRLPHLLHVILGTPEGREKTCKE
jgi:hypothetical protein